MQTSAKKPDKKPPYLTGAESGATKAKIKAAISKYMGGK